MTHRNYFGPMQTNETECPVCEKRTLVRQSGASRYIATHHVVINGSPETCAGSRSLISARSVQPR